MLELLSFAQLNGITARNLVGRWCFQQELLWNSGGTPKWVERVIISSPRFSLFQRKWFCFRGCNVALGSQLTISTSAEPPRNQFSYVDVCVCSNWGSQRFRILPPPYLRISVLFCVRPSPNCKFLHFHIYGEGLANCLKRSPEVPQHQKIIWKANALVARPLNTLA